MRITRLFVPITIATLGAACASAPPAAPKAPTISNDRRMSGILQMEDQRILRVPPPPAPAEPAVPPGPQKKPKNPPPPPPPVVTPDRSEEHTSELQSHSFIS